MMNFSTEAHGSSPTTNKENVPPSSYQRDGSEVQAAKRRPVLGVLSEHELHARSLSQGSQPSKHSSVSDSSQLALLSCPSSSSFDMYVQKSCEVVLAACGDEMMSDAEVLGDEAAALDAVRHLLELSSSSCHDASTQSRPDDSLLSEEVMCVSEYAEEIHQHMRETEVKFRPKPGHLEKHPEITSSMRVIVVDWLVEVTQEFKMSGETLHLAVNYLDRFLSRTSDVKRCQLQLLGTTALMIAAKYEEIDPPEVDDFVYITDSTYSRKHLLRMERVFLRVLGFKMTAPTVFQFVRLLVSIQSVCRRTENLILLVADLSLLETDAFVQYNPSVLAAAAFCLANYTVNESLWPDSLRAFTGYTMAEIVPCLIDLHKLYADAEGRPQQAVREKYRSSKYHSVSWIAPPTVLPLQ